MITINNRTYRVNITECLNAYFIKGVEWDDISGSSYFSSEDRAAMFGPDCTLDTMREIRQSDEFRDIVRDFAQTHGYDVHYCLQMAIYKPREPKVRRRPPAQTTITHAEEHRIITDAEEHRIITDAAKCVSDTKELIGMVTNLTETVLTLQERMDALEAR